MSETTEGTTEESGAKPQMGRIRALLTDRFLHDVLITAFVYSIVRLALFPNIPALGRPLQLPFEAYQSSSIVLSALTNPAFLALVGSGVLALVLDQIPGKRNPFFGRVDWGEFPPRTSWLVLAFCFPMMWKFATYDVNLLLGQVHLMDRIVVVVLWAAMARNPAFAPMWLAVVAVVAEQFKYPSCMHATWADKAILLYVPLLVWITFVVSRVRRISPWVFPALLLCHWASFYVYPAISKMLLGPAPWSWAMENRVHHLFLGSYVNGWLADLSDVEAVRAAQMLARFDVPLQMATMATELAPLFILFRRRLAALIVSACAAMHLGIYLSSGIFFWEWMLPEAALVIALLGPWGSEPVASLFQHRHRLLSALLIAFALPVFWPYMLGWWDTPYNVVYDVEVEDASGNRYDLQREYMDPFNVQHTQGRYSFTDARPNLPTATYGASADYRLYRALLGLKDGVDPADLMDEHAVVRFDEEAAAEFVQYLQIYFSRLNLRDGEKRVVPAFLTAPHHQRVTGGVLPADPWVDIVRLRILARDIYYDGERLVPIEDVEVLVIDIPPEPPPFTPANVSH